MSDKMLRATREGLEVEVSACIGLLERESRLTPSRELALAITNLQQGLLWLRVVPEKG